MAHEKADPLAEAEVFLAYGRRQEAARILQEALRREPNREDLRRKLKELGPQDVRRASPASISRKVDGWFNKIPLWVITGVLCICGIAVSAFFAVDLVKASRAQSWASVTGTVIESRVGGYCGKYGIPVPAVRYKYIYDSREYEGSRIGFDNCQSESTARSTLATFAQGKSVTVWVNPAAPSEAALIVGSTNGYYARTWVRAIGPAGVGIAVLIVPYLLFWIMKRNKRRALAQKTNPRGPG